MVASDDPDEITAIAVRREDVVSAFEANQRNARRRHVLRVTAPYSGRMRARLHREGDADYEVGVDAVHLPPGWLLDDPPALPSPDDTEDELRSDPDLTYSRDRHQQYHERRVEDWRATIGDRIVDAVELDLADALEIDVVVLGDP